MRIAVFTNLYPPAFIGGYEIGASNVVKELRKRGHEILLLASHEAFVIFDTTIVRLHHEEATRSELTDTGFCLMGPLGKFIRKRPWTTVKGIARTLLARRRYRKLLETFQPEAMLAFNPFGVAATVVDDFIEHSRKTGVPVGAYISDHWVAGWPGGHPLARALGRMYYSPSRKMQIAGKVLARVLRRLGLNPNPMPMIDHHLYCSRFILNLSRLNSMGVADHRVVHWGLPNLKRESAKLPDRFHGDAPLTIVYAGQIIEHKGLITLIHALARCEKKHTVVVIGDDTVPHAEFCKARAAKLGVLEQIQFVGKKSNAEMLKYMSTVGHVLVVPSVWDEPFSIVVLEGMAAGLVVVSTKTGGTPEAIQHGSNGFLFTRNHPKELSAILNQLEGDRNLTAEVAQRGQDIIYERFTMEAMVDQILEAFRKPEMAAVPRRAAA